MIDAAPTPIAALAQAIGRCPEAIDALLALVPEPPDPPPDPPDPSRWLTDGPEALPAAWLSAAFPGVEAPRAPDGGTVAAQGMRWASSRGRRGEGAKSLIEWYAGCSWAERLTRPWWEPPGLLAANPAGDRWALAPLLAACRRVLEAGRAVAARRREAGCRRHAEEAFALLAADPDTPVATAAQILLDGPDGMAAWVEAHWATLGHMARRAARQAGWGWADLKAALREALARREGPPGRRAPALRVVGEGGGMALGDVWPAPDLAEAARGLVLPPGHRLDAQGTYLVQADALTGEPRALPIAAGPVAVTGLAEDVESGELWVRCAWVDLGGGRTVEATIPHGALGGRTPPADLGNLGAPILAGQWPRLAEYLTRMARVNGPAIPRTPIVQHTGWVWPAEPGGVVRFAMPGRTITAAPGDPPVALHAPHQPRLDAYAPAGDLAGERETVAMILADPAFRRLVWVLGHAAAAPWARLLADVGALDVTGWAVEVVSAATGTGKTLSLLVAMLPWGRPADLVRPWWGTEYALTHFLAARRDLPVAMQEAQMNQSGRAGRDAVGVAQVIHALADGGGKLQGRRDGGLRAAPQLGGVLLLANNQSVVGDVHQPGAAVRVLSCEPLVEPLETARAIRDLRARLALHHGHGGAAMIQRALAETAGDPRALLAWVREEFEQAWGIVEKAFEARLGYWRSTGRRELASQVERAAHLIAAGAMGVVMLLHDGYGLDDPQIAQALRIYLRQAQEIVEGWEAERAPMWLQALRAIGEGVFGQASRIVGMEPRLGEGGERRMPTQDYIGGWIALRDLPGEWAVDHDVLAISPQWVRRTVADALQTQDVRGLVREWVRQRVLIPRLDGGRIVRPERTVRLRRADGEQITAAMWVFRPTLPDGRVWLPLPAGHPLDLGAGDAAEAPGGDPLD